MAIQKKCFIVLAFITVFSCTECFAYTAAELLDAAAKGEIEKIVKILKAPLPVKSKKSAKVQDAKINVDCKNDDGRTPLMQAAYRGHISVVKILIENKADINAVDAVGTSSLSLAVSGRKNDVCKYLIEQKADVNIKDKNGQTPLIRAIQCDNNEIVSQLLNTGADINVQDNEGNTPLIMAVQKKQNEIVELLIKKGAEANKKDKKNKSAMDYTGNNPKLKILIGSEK